jgi:ADP-ribosylglycohydrolase
MLGAIAGDIIGSIYELHQIKTKDFPLFDSRCQFTDDTVLTVAVADALLNGGTYHQRFREYFFRYPNAGYGGTFFHWIQAGHPEPYNSFGNGSAMRVSPVGYGFDTMDAVLAEAKRSAEISHNHAEGIKGAQAVAGSVFLARTGGGKSAIQAFGESLGYDLSGRLDEIRPHYKFDVTCQGSLPVALLSVLESTDFEDAIRNAISLGGDSDTLACIAGAIAEPLYGGVPVAIAEETMARLDDALRRVVRQFRGRYLLT